MHVHLARPDITVREWQAVKEVLFSQSLSMGPQTRAFEEAAARYVGTKYAVSVNSGTSGLHLLVRSLEIKKGDEVITTPFSFIASSNCILFENATPVFADIDPTTLNIDPDRIEEKITRRTKAILPVHVFGHPVNMDAIKSLADYYHLMIIEDACEAIGAEFHSQKAGTLGDGAVFAFYPNKQITTGEGGMIVTDNSEISKLCISMRNQGRGEDEGWLKHERIGFNYRMDEMSAALGLIQLERLEEILTKRETVASMYRERLQDLPEVTLPPVQPNVKTSWFVFVIRLDEKLDRDKIMSFLRSKGIECRPYFSPIHLQPAYRNLFHYRPGSFPVTEKISQSTLALPFYNNLTAEEIDYVVETLRIGIKKSP